MGHPLAFADWWGIPFGIGIAVILIGFLVVGTISRHRKETKTERHREDAEADALIVHNAEAAGWGPPRERRHRRT